MSPAFSRRLTRIRQGLGDRPAASARSTLLTRPLRCQPNALIGTSGRCDADNDLGSTTKHRCAGGYPRFGVPAHVAAALKAAPTPHRPAATVL